MRSILDENLLEIVQIENVQYKIYGDGVYNQRWYLEVSFQTADVTATQKSFNTAMPSSVKKGECEFEELKIYFTTVAYKYGKSEQVADLITLYSIDASV